MAGSSEPVGLSPTERAFLRALQSQGVPFESKRAANRDKDRAVLPALEAALVALRSRERTP